MTAPAPPRNRQQEVAPTDLPASGADAEEGWGWTRRQRIGLGILLLILLSFLIIQYVRRPFRLDDHVVILHGERVTLPGRIDPNTAGIQELTRIPHLGEKLAARIIAYRDARKEMAADGIVFRQSQDMDHVPGLGKKTLEMLLPFLQFPEDAETEPAQ